MVLLATTVAGCAYISHKEFDAIYDADGDLWPFDQDCRPNDPLYHPYAHDVRGDGCDHDCGTELDTDGDDWPDAADCDPQNPLAFPCSPHESTSDGGLDLDCDGLDTARTDVCLGLDPDFPPDTPPPRCDPGDGNPDGATPDAQATR